MSSSQKPTHSDDSTQQPKKRGKTLQPLHEEEIKASLAGEKKLQDANTDVLAELAAKTAALTEHMQDEQENKSRVLKLDSYDTDELSEAVNSSQPVDKNDKGNPAADLIRAKLQHLYKKEPDAGTEAAEAVASRHRSKHQQFMYELTTSGKTLAEIQTEWHNYYVGLPDSEKHVVWQEFYNTQATLTAYGREVTSKDGHRTKEVAKKSTQAKAERKPYYRPLDPRNGDVKAQLLDKINAGGKLKPIHHIKSALFGLGLAGAVGVIIAFVFFNEVFIAPFISPSKTVSATPIIGQVDGAVDKDPKIIIPKINLEVPVVYGLGSIDEEAVQDALEDGVVHYATTPEPGEQGNVVIVGHSSNNILNSGKYKFAFVLLRRLEKEDTFFVHKDGVRYTYKVYDTTVVSPDEVSVLGPAERDNTITLITCDPPGTSLNRLIVKAEQISPDPSTNTAATIDVQPEETSTNALPSNAPTLWSRLWPF